MADVDSIGLRREDRQYLTTLIENFQGRPAGVEAIAHTINAATDTLEEEIEPFLLRIGFVVRTARGRLVQAKAYEHLSLKPPAPPKTDKNSEDQQELF
jgi:Holliday junction DNA helicase RuvB